MVFGLGGGGGSAGIAALGLALAAACLSLLGSSHPMTDAATVKTKAQRTNRSDPENMGAECSGLGRDREMNGTRDLRAGLSLAIVGA